jgi:hypothetical protein
MNSFAHGALCTLIRLIDMFLIGSSMYFIMFKIFLLARLWGWLLIFVGFTIALMIFDAVLSHLNVKWVISAEIISLLIIGLISYGLGSLDWMLM